MAARQAALEKLGIKQALDFEDAIKYTASLISAFLSTRPQWILSTAQSLLRVLPQLHCTLSILFRQPNRPLTCTSSALRRGRRCSRSTYALPVIFERAVRKPLCRYISRLSSDKRFNERKCAMRAVALARSKIQNVHSTSSSCSSSSSSWAAARIQARICLRFACLMSRTPPVRVSQWMVSAASNKGPPVTGSKLSVSTLIRPSTGEPLARPGA